MTTTPAFIALAAGLNLVVALAARWRRSVRWSGAAAGFAGGTGILIAGGFVHWGMLMLFFISSSVMSHVGARTKASLAAMHEKGGERDGVQAIANAGAGVAACVLAALTGWPALAVAAAGGFAAANADTWASELGVLSTRPPRSIITGRELPAGTSGGVTPGGTLASIAGSALIGLWFALWVVLQRDGGNVVSGSVVSGFAQLPGSAATVAGASSTAAAAALSRVVTAAILAVIVTGAGAVGSLIDSLLGATVQALYRTDDGALTERRTGEDGRVLVGGYRFITNDAVNFVSTCAAAIAAGGAAAVIWAIVAGL